jgi:hypothetical protein
MRTISAVGEGRRGTAAVPDETGCTGCTEVDGEVRRADGAPRRTPVAQQRPCSDTRRSAHTDRGTSTFEFAVSAAASIGAHLSGEGFAKAHHRRGEIPRAAPSGHPARHARGHHPRTPPASGPAPGAGPGGRQLIAVISTVCGRRPPAGREPWEHARDGAAARRLGVGDRRDNRGHGADGGDPAAAGWRVAVASASTPLAAAWQQCTAFDPASRPVPLGGLGSDLR